MTQILKEVESCLEQFKKLPDWERWPMPETFYKTFNIPKPKPAEINEYLYSSFDNMFIPKENGVEERAPAEGGVRTIELPPPPPVETEVIPDAPKEEPKPEAKLVEDVPLKTVTFRSFGKADVHYDRADKVDAQAAVSKTE